MPPKRGPKGRKLCGELSPNAEIPASRLFPALVATKEIGKGGFGRVYAGKVKDTKEEIAIKIEATGSGGLFVEMKMFQTVLTKKKLEERKKKEGLKFLGLPHCVAFGIFTYKGEDLRYVAMPLYKGSLQGHIDHQKNKVISVDECKQIIPAVCDAFDYLHSEGIVHADLKAENLMFSLKSPKDLTKLTLIDFGIAGRKTELAVDQPDKRKAHDGTALYTSTDAHRGCKPSFRSDYEILGHNLFIWLVGLKNIPWDSCITNLEKVHQLKTNVIKKPAEVQKIAGDKEASDLISGVYSISSGTGYSDRVDSDRIKALLTKSKASKAKKTVDKQPGTSKPTVNRKRHVEEEEEPSEKTEETSDYEETTEETSEQTTEPSSEVNVIPGSPPNSNDHSKPRRLNTHKSRSDVKKVAREERQNEEVLKKTNANDRLQRANRRRVALEPVEITDSTSNDVENEDSTSKTSSDGSKRRKIQKPSPTKVRDIKPKDQTTEKLKKPVSLDKTLSPGAQESLRQKDPRFRFFSKLTKRMEKKYQK